MHTFSLARKPRHNRIQLLISSHGSRNFKYIIKMPTCKARICDMWVSGTLTNSKLTGMPLASNFIFMLKRAHKQDWVIRNYKFKTPPSLLLNNKKYYLVRVKSDTDSSNLHLSLLLPTEMVSIFFSSNKKMTLYYIFNKSCNPVLNI